MAKQQGGENTEFLKKKDAYYVCVMVNIQKKIHNTERWIKGC